MHNIPIKQSGIRSATIKCEQLGGINLGQGVCDLHTPNSLKLAAINSIINDKNTYADFQGVYELRIQFGSGYRIYFCQFGVTIILLLCGGDKSTQQQDIEKAKEYWRNYYARR